MENSSEFWILVGVAGVFVGALVTYLVFMVFLPEWVGITGKVALDAERSHQEGSVAKGGDLGGPPPGVASPKGPASGGTGRSD